jgi:hypothetical protein
MTWSGIEPVRCCKLQLIFCSYFIACSSKLFRFLSVVLPGVSYVAHNLLFIFFRSEWKVIGTLLVISTCLPRVIRRREFPWHVHDTCVCIGTSFETQRKLPKVKTFESSAFSNIVVFFSFPASCIKSLWAPSALVGSLVSDKSTSRSLRYAILPYLFISVTGSHIIYYGSPLTLYEFPSLLTRSFSV